MLERFNFYIQHSLSDLRANIFRTIFIVICISVGVAAVTSLQNMGVMIEDTLLGNLQEQNRGDVSLTISDDNTRFNEDPNGDRPIEESFSNEYQAGFEAGTISVYSPAASFPTSAVLTQKIVPALQEWADKNYDGEVEILANSYGNSDFIGIIFGTAPGAFMTNESNNNSASQQFAIFVDPERYPFYFEVETLDGKPLAEVINDPRDIVLSERTATLLEAEVGDSIQLQKFDGMFTVAGIVPNDAEIKGIADIFFGFFGYYYMDVESLEAFSTVDEVSLSTVFLKLENPEDAAQIAEDITSAFPYLSATTTDDLLELNEVVADNINLILKAIGLFALLLGSIGIINTMQVIVRRRTLEIGVLKTIGLKGRQITLLFIVEAILLGIIGSLIGILISTLGIFAVRDVAEILTSQNLEFKIDSDPILNGLIVGMVVTTVFGFLPTLTAAKVRPSIVLRPKEAIAPRSGILAIFFTLVLAILILAVTVMSVLDFSFLMSAAVVAGVFVAGMILFPILWLTIWFVARVAPKFGSAELELAKTEIRTSKSRSAVTLLALVIGIFSLSSITLFADAFSSLIDELFAEVSGGRPVYVQLTDPSGADKAERIIQANNYVDDYQVQRVYDTRIISWTTLDGETILISPSDDIGIGFGEFDEMDEEFDAPPPPVDLTQLQIDKAYLARHLNDGIHAFTLDNVQYPTNNALSGRLLSEADIETPGIVLRRGDGELGIQVGDQVTVAFGSGRNAPQVTYTIVGFVGYPEVEMSFGDDDAVDDFILLPTIPEGVEPETVSFNIAMPADKVVTLQRDMQVLSNVFVIDTRIFSDLIDIIVEKFVYFPTLFGVVGLIVGAVVIANSVALSTLERRRDIAVLKSIGLKRRGVLTMILAENALLGLVGALLGVGFGVAALAIFDWYEDDIDIDINWTIAAAMTILSIGLAMASAMVAAWKSSGEKPLNVLRYE